MRRVRGESSGGPGNQSPSAAASPSKRARHAAEVGAVATDGVDHDADSVLALLPNEILAHILSYLKRIVLLRAASAVCRKWRLVALTLVTSLTPKSFSRVLLAKMPGLRTLCLGGLGKHRHTHPIELPGLRELSLSPSESCDCVLWERLPSLTQLSISLKPSHPCALRVLGCYAHKLTKLTLNYNHGCFDAPLIELVGSGVLDSVRELSLLRQEEPNFCDFMLPALGPQLTSLCIQRFGGPGEADMLNTLQGLFTSVSFPNLVAASLLFKPTRNIVFALLKSAPSLNELVLGVHPDVLRDVAPRVCSLLVGLQLLIPMEHTLSAIQMCTRLTSLSPLLLPSGM